MVMFIELSPPTHLHPHFTLRHIMNLSHVGCGGSIRGAGGTL
jgi:hypothetical protein